MSIKFKNAEYYLRTHGKKAKPVVGTLLFEPAAKAVRFVVSMKVGCKYEWKKTVRALIGIPALTHQLNLRTVGMASRMSRTGCVLITVLMLTSNSIVTQPTK
jgi:hypothetical protein